ncbi:MAG: hypothetical protein KF764_05285 [Labilithrix sp.]|nr:hypothetical protein [Labilithrix sp.]MBX3219109.1 hypothetical protein [Labilithrix sp.]
MGRRTTGTVVALGVVLVACSGADPAPTIIVIQQAPPAPDSEPDDGETTSTPTVVPNPCESFQTTTYATGDRCGLEQAGQATCSDPPVDGFVYACIDKGGQPTRPDLLNCLVKARVDGITRVVCPRAACLPFDDGRCTTAGYRREVACPAPELQLIPPPSTNVSGEAKPCRRTGDWTIGTAAGAVYCCL